MDLPDMEDDVDEAIAEEDDFDEESDKVEAVCKEGDLWQLGEHRLLCGDSTKQECIDMLTGGGMMDLWLTDPPYNVAYEGGTKEKLKISNDNMDSNSFYQFLRSAFSAVYNVLKDGAAHYFVKDRKQTTVYEDDLDKMKKEDLKQMIRSIFDTTIPTTVINESKPARNGEHPTMKPLKLIGRLISNSSRKGETVLDTFGGSGSTMMAAEQLGRKCYMMELDPHYCDVIISRWEKMTGKKAKKIN